MTAVKETGQARLLTLIDRCRQIAREIPRTEAAQHLLGLAAQHVQKPNDRERRR
jgi:hypothetical protein